MLSCLRCVFCCDDEINTQNYYDRTPAQSSDYHAVPYNYDTFSPYSIPTTQTATTTRRQDFCTINRLPQESNTPSVNNQPKQTLPKTKVNVNTRGSSKETPDIPNATRTNVFPKSTGSSYSVPLPPPPAPVLASSFSASSSSPFGPIPGSPKSPLVSNKPTPKSPLVSNKPILARAVSTPTSNQTKSQYNVVEKGSTPLYAIPENINDLIRKDIVPGVLRKPLSPQTYKDYFAALLYAEDYYFEVLGNRYQSLPTTQRDLKNHNSFSRIDSPNSIPSATATTTRIQNLPTSSNFTPKPNTTSSVYNQPQDTLPRVNVKVDSVVYPKTTADVPTETHTNAFQKSTNCTIVPFKVGGKLPPSESPKLASSSSFPFGAIRGSPKSPSVTYKPILACAVSNPMSNQTKSQYNVVEKGSTPLYVIPEDIKGLIWKDIVPGVLRKPLSPQTYKDYFAALLYAEDYYFEKWKEFEMKNVTLKFNEAEIYGRKGKSKNKNNDRKDEKIFVEFELDSIPEKRPFLLSRDFASVRPTGREVDPFQGIIFRVVRSNIVLVEFGEDFHAQHYSSCKYDVKFSFNRVCLKRAHEAIAAASDMLFTKFLFPDCRPKSSYICDSDFFTEKIMFNRHKFDSVAISRIINHNGPPAYLLEGPLSINNEKQLSGTGMVVRDAVVQLCQASSQNRILLSAPTNSACDVFMRSLRKEVGDSNIFRANAAFREFDGVPIDIRHFCPYKKKEEVFTCPSLSQLLKFRVILSTFISSFRLHNEGIRGGHFTHIILVDTSSVIEPEILVPLTNLTSASTNVVVTGAPGNRSHWIRSDIARQNGLRTSYFERLRNSKLYRDLNPEFITQLKDDDSTASSTYLR